MSKRHLNSTQPPHAVSHPDIISREKPPLAVATKKGIELRCPFCDDHHVLRPDKEAECGTRISVMATQEVLPARFVRLKNLVCIKCHQTGGDMVRYRNGYVHLTDCTPGTRLIQELPKFSPFAGAVFKTPARVRGLLERFTGQADQVLEIDELGEKTGKVLGYFFYNRVNNNAKSKPV